MTPVRKTAGFAAPAHSEDTLNTSINTTPLVDVMLVLLIIFLITIPVVRQTVPMSLPKESSVVRETRPENVELSIDRGGALYWNGLPAPEGDALSQRLVALAAQRPQPQVQIRADEQVPYAAVGRAVYACQQAGIQTLGFITEPAPAT
ncbi:ExbD/TolR family protein [Sphingomonas sp. NCPPB 2930]